MGDLLLYDWDGDGAGHGCPGAGGAGMRMSRRMGIYSSGAPSEVSITIIGAPGETISYTGGSIVLSSVGSATITTTPSNTFTGSISGWSKTISNMVAGGTYLIMRDNPIYWYGNGDSSGEYLYNNVTGGFGSNFSIYPSGANRNREFPASVSISANKVSLNCNYTKYGTSYVLTNCLFINNAIAKNGKSNLNIVYSVSSYGNGAAIPVAYLANGLSASFSSYGNASLSSTSTAMSLSNVSTSFYFATHFSAYGNYVGSSVDIQAMWLKLIM